MNKNSYIQLLFGLKQDGIVEAVHYTPSGKIDWVRAYERRGPTWSDHVLLDRDALVERLENGKRFFVGKRIPLEASEFEIGERLKLVKSGKRSFVGTGENHITKNDYLKDVPLI
ncbi:MAG: hypothetical protein N2D54_05585 [Chloroflexota bacterium]